MGQVQLDELKRNRPSRETDFASNVVAVARVKATRRYVVLGTTSWAAFLGDVVASAQSEGHSIPSGDATMIGILSTCYGDQLDRRSGFGSPFHPARWNQIRLALSKTLSEQRDPPALAVALNQVLWEHLPDVLKSLRGTTGFALYRKARSRLAERVSDTLLGKDRRRKRPEDAFADSEAHPDLGDQAESENALGKRRKQIDERLPRLSPRERELVAAIRSGEDPAEWGRANRLNPSTVRVMLFNIRRKLRPPPA